MTGEEKARRRFEADTAEHEMSVLHDDELYRHMRFKAPDTICFYYDLVTWPGYLAIVGDAGDYVFSRVRDMFTFFESEQDRINPHYWSEKLQAPRGTRSAEVYSHDVLVARVHEWAREHCEWDEYGDLVYPSLLIGAIDREILDGWTTYEAEGRERLELLEDAVGHMDVWEWDLREFDGHFLWCCWAIVRGIARYRAAQVPTGGAA